ncbi:transposase [Kitasatospora sp. GAS1066B]
MALVVDSQSVKAADTVPRATSGYDPAKKITGRKRHLAVDLGGLLVDLLVTPADVSDREGARRLLARLHAAHPEITIVWADSAYAGELVDWAEKAPPHHSQDRQTAARCPGLHRPAPQVGRGTQSAWFMRARRNCRDYERLPAHAEAHLQWSAITPMRRHLARTARAPAQPVVALAV